VTRYAIVRGARDQKEVEAYLPRNYRVVAEVPAWWYDHLVNPVAVWVIQGQDDHGWTLDGYVIPRLKSGLIGCEEIDLSHPVMKEVPV
jgi:hypothetical protein